MPSWRERVTQLRQETYTVYLAARDPRTPWYAKALAVSVLVYALSPIDLIPDFIPVLGHLDDLILVPLGILIVIRLIPQEVMAESRVRAANGFSHAPEAKGATLIVASTWIVLVLLVGFLAWQALR